jgi:hypothetical protein
MNAIRSAAILPAPAGGAGATKLGCCTDDPPAMEFPIDGEYAFAYVGAYPDCVGDEPISCCAGTALEVPIGGEYAGAYAGANPECCGDEPEVCVGEAPISDCIGIWREGAGGTGASQAEEAPP